MSFVIHRTTSVSPTVLLSMTPLRSFPPVSTSSGTDNTTPYLSSRTSRRPRSSRKFVSTLFLLRDENPLRESGRPFFRPILLRIGLSTPRRDLTPVSLFLCTLVLSPRPPTDPRPSLSLRLGPTGGSRHRPSTRGSTPRVTLLVHPYLLLLSVRTQPCLRVSGSRRRRPL